MSVVENKLLENAPAEPRSLRDIGFAVGILGILAILFIPIPPFLIDFGLAISISLSVLILMVSLWIQKPLDFSAFPTVLLISTILRLSLGIATTRLILARGDDGVFAAGHIIQGFSRFVMSGDFVIGIVVFLILVTVNFVVITKGATRIAEVGARFTLDAIPGKQMAIDADLNAGLIDDKEAQRRRRELEEESSFFGSMDGASKFVRGEAIASIIVIAVNIFGGIIIGVTRHGMALSDAADVFTRLSVGDGLVSQIPALIISLAAGLLVSKGGTRGPAERAVVDQLSAYPRALLVASVLMFILGVVPGLPLLPFWFLGIGLAGGVVHDPEAGGGAPRGGGGQGAREGRAGPRGSQEFGEGGAQDRRDRAARRQAACLERAAQRRRRSPAASARCGGNSRCSTASSCLRYASARASRCPRRATRSRFTARRSRRRRCASASTWW